MKVPFIWLFNGLLDFFLTFTFQSPHNAGILWFPNLKMLLDKRFIMLEPKNTTVWQNQGIMEISPANPIFFRYDYWYTPLILICFASYKCGGSSVELKTSSNLGRSTTFEFWCPNAGLFFSKSAFHFFVMHACFQSNNGLHWTKRKIYSTYWRKIMRAKTPF